MAQVEARDRRILPVVAISYPFIFIRILYTVLSDFVDSDKFNTLFSNFTIYLYMSVLKETVVIMVSIVLEFTMPVIRRQDSDVTTDEGQF